VRIRPATAQDAETMARIAAPGFESYRAFAPPTYEPPALNHEVAQFRLSFDAGDYWARLAEDDEGPVGQAGFRTREIEPGLVHFQRLFVLERGWGSGLSSQLLGLALDEMRRHGFAQARLFTPAGQARARAFYEREGWTVHGDPAPEPRLGGLEVVEYRLSLP
jgi:GNAT superfamily N-acetyltransferase